jgi:starch synthase
MKILFAASECIPFCKTGGLADVVGALPKELRKKRHDVRVILPKYKAIRGQEFGMKETGERVRVSIGGRWEEGDIRTAKTDRGGKVYFVNHEGYFGRWGLYRQGDRDYPDNAERFIFFCRAVLEACKAVDFRPDIIHCHDWQTGLIPVYLKTLTASDAFFQHTGSVFTVHNMAYQGIFDKGVLLLAGLSWSEFTMEQLEFYDKVNFLKGGLTYADQLTTVSPSYAQEIQSSYEFGWGLEGTVRRRAADLTGILNGLDVDEWNPAKDPFLPKSFEVGSIAGRKDCKSYLQETLKLPVEPRTPVLGMVARLDPQKGVDLLTHIAAPLLNHGVQIIVLGQGDPHYQRVLGSLEKRFPRAFRLRTDFNEPLAHHIYGGSDIFLMPSRYEPCGLGQLIAMRYGSIPVTSATGGLRDTILPAGPGESGTGFLFYELRPEAFAAKIQEALKQYAQPASWGRLQERAMTADFSWEASVPAYLAVYRHTLHLQTHRRAPVRLFRNR